MIDQAPGKDADPFPLLKKVAIRERLSHPCSWTWCKSNRCPARKGFQNHVLRKTLLYGTAPMRQKDTSIFAACMRRLLCGKEPKEQRNLRRLVLGLGDTLLLAKTGFGKSIIFHAYSILTGKITIQLVPLSKLGAGSGNRQIPSRWQVPVDVPRNQSKECK